MGHRGHALGGGVAQGTDPIQQILQAGPQGLGLVRGNREAGESREFFEISCAQADGAIGIQRETSYKNMDNARICLFSLDF